MSEAMKMKELKEKLHDEGYDISERMIKYYIEIGILPAPDYTHPNQAKYSNIHLIRLKRIGKMKADNLTFNEIKTMLLQETEKINEKASDKGIGYEQMRNLSSADIKEEADFIFSSIKDQQDVYDKHELLNRLNCDKIIFDLAVDTGALEEKGSYDQNDLFVLLCVKNLIESENTDDKTANIIEKISEISKINNIAAQMVHFFSKQPDRTWIYSYLLQSIINRKLSAEETNDSMNLK